MELQPVPYDSIEWRPGYAVIHRLLTKVEVAQLIGEVEAVRRNGDPCWLQLNSARTEGGEYLVIRSIDIRSDLIFQLGRNPVLIALAEKFARKRVTPLYVEFFDKPPRCGAATPLHQDHAFYNEHFPDELGITFWIALEDCDDSNGCMHVRPQSISQLYPHLRSNQLGFGFEMQDQDLQGLVPLPLGAGGAILFGSFTPHFCPPNLSDRSRMALAVSFRTSEFREDMSPWKE
jgi:hypothetical protein